MNSPVYGQSDILLHPGTKYPSDCVCASMCMFVCVLRKSREGIWCLCPTPQQLLRFAVTELSGSNLKCSSLDPDRVTSTSTHMHVH